MLPFALIESLIMLRENITDQLNRTDNPNLLESIDNSLDKLITNYIIKNNKI